MPLTATRPLGIPAALAAALVLAACGGPEGSGDDTATLTVDPGTARMVGTIGADRIGAIEGFDTPESVKYDPDQTVYFVSNIAGNPTDADGNGWIARVTADDAHTVTRFIEGGKSGVTLNAPKGMAIVGDTLWVADIDVVRGFDRRTGAPVATIAMPRPARFLNDLAVGPDGALYVTDTGMGEGTPGPFQIFRIAPDRSVSLAIADERLNGPNGITYDSTRKAFIVVSFSGNSIFSWEPGSAPRQIATGPGQFDGVEAVAGGRLLVSSWADSSVYALEPDSTTMRRVVPNVPSPADIGIDTHRFLLLVPIFMGNRVDIWTYPSAPVGSTVGGPAMAPAATPDTSRR